MPQPFKLFYAPHTCALASHIALEDALADYVAIRIDFSREEQRKRDYLTINPKGHVPALVTGQGTLTETPAILAFIAQSFPDAGLAPLSDPFSFARIQSFNSYLCSTVHIAHAHRMRGYRWADGEVAIKAMQRKVPQSVGSCFSLIEKEMFIGPWVTGATYTICDPYLFTLSQWLEADGVDIRKLPKISEHRQRMQERPAVKKAISMEIQAVV